MRFKMLISSNKKDTGSAGICIGYLPEKEQIIHQLLTKANRVEVIGCSGGMLSIRISDLSRLSGAGPMPGRWPWEKYDIHASQCHIELTEWSVEFQLKDG
jgi:hypothetical protein